MLADLVGWGRHYLARASTNTPPFRGKAGLMGTLDRGLRRLDRQPRQARVNGAEFCLDTSDPIDFALMYQGGGRNLVRYIRQQFRGRRGVLWDVGANVGSVCLPVAVGCPSTTAYAFEPSPPLMQRLERNLAANPSVAERVTLVPATLADKNRKARPLGAASEEMPAGDCAPMPVPTSVPTVRGDDLIAAGEAAVPDVIKVDVPGFELEALLGLGDLLSGTHALVVIYEHAPKRLRERELPAERIPAHLLERGFGLFVFDDPARNRVRRWAPIDLDRTCTVVARRT